MWMEPLSQLVIAAALLGQTAVTLPEPYISRQAAFVVPFHVKPVSDPSREVVEVQLHVSTDRGQHWQLYTKAQPTQKQFLFRSSSDGEYWFAVRTLDRSGQLRPDKISMPELRVRVETKASQTQSNASRDRTAQRPVTRSDQNAGPSLEPKGSVAIAINPAVGKKFNPSQPFGDAPTIPGLPQGERPRMVNSQMFQLDFDIDSVGPSGVGRVELWGTRDMGKTWKSYSSVNGSRGPLLANVKEEGLYGFTAVVTNGVGMGGKPPSSGDIPDLWVGVDLTKPTARITSAQQGVDSEAGQLIISWRADDRMLAARPVSLSFSTNRSGPWLPIASGLENSGRYAWPIDNRTPSQFYLRLEVRDEAGNVGVNETSEPVTIDQSQPTIRVRDVRPVGETSSRSIRRR
jgi:hypothetical protein